MEFIDNKTQLNVINTNARSIRPKIKSFITCFMNLTLTLAIVTETWLANGSSLELQAESLLLGSGLRIHTLNREPLASGVAYGGVALILRDATTKSELFRFPNPECFEVLPISIKVSEVPRKLFAIAAYIPPNYAMPRGRACLQHVADLVLTISNRHQDPLIIVGGDFNQWDISEALSEFDNIMEVSTPPTRGDRRIDRLFTNWQEYIEEAGCIPPLHTEEVDGEVAVSDHQVQYLISRLPRRNPVKWESYSYRPYSTTGERDFLEELGRHDWRGLLRMSGVNAKTEELHRVLSDLLGRHFPIKTVRRRDTDLPWLDARAKKMIKKKAAIFKAEGPSNRWERMRVRVDEYLEKRRQDFLKIQRDKFIGPQAHVSFFANIKAFKSAEKPKSFDVRDLCPGLSDIEVANQVASYFNTISQEFTPLSTHQIPFTYHRDLGHLTEEEVEGMIRSAKKPRSMVDGDIFPALFNAGARILRTPMAAIFNDMIRTLVWPKAWKREFVTVIPKKNRPESFSDLRNISCTPLLSKIFEAFLLKKIKEETGLKTNQFGGVKGCSTTHMVVGLLQEICENAEDYRSATILTAIDYSKAFNRVSFQHCLEAFRRKGASTPVLRLIASFLTGRTMSVRVGEAWSEPLEVNGGCPQGSVLGVRLFNTTTDNLEDEFLDQERRRLLLPDVRAPASPPPPPLPPPTGPMSSSPSNVGPPLASDISPISAGGFAYDSVHARFKPRLPPPRAAAEQPVLLDPPLGRRCWFKSRSESLSTSTITSSVKN